MQSDQSVWNDFTWQLLQVRYCLHVLEDLALVHNTQVLNAFRLLHTTLDDHI